MNKYILIFFVLFGTVVAHAQTNNKLENDNIYAVFDLNSGSLMDLVNKKTGWKVLSDRKYSCSFRMKIKLANGSNLNIDGKTQQKPIVKVDKKQITFTWNEIKTNDKNLSISFTGKVNIHDREGLVYSGEVRNNSDAVIEELVWPYVGDISIPKGSPIFQHQHINYSNLTSTEIYPTTQNYGGSSSLPVNSFALFNNLKEGLYVSSKDQNLSEYVNCRYNILPSDDLSKIIGSAWSKKDNGERLKMRMEIQAIRMIFVQPYSEVKLVDVVLTPYTGTWHVAVDIYKEWRATWYVAPHRPDWIKRVNSWQQLQINSSEDYLNFPYKDLVSYARDCKKYGVDAIQLTGWNLGGQDKCIPSHSTDPRLGTFEDLKKAIAESKKMGVNILLFTKFTWAEVTWEGFPQYKDYIAWTRNLQECDHGGYSYNTFSQFKGISIRRFKVLCMNEDGCRSLLKKEFQKCLDLGAQGMVYDENQHHAGNWQCFNFNHQHQKPVSLYKGGDLLGRDFMEMVKKQNPDFFMAGEACYDLQAKYYGTYTREDVRHTAGMRYIDPELPIACAVMSHNDRDKINSSLRCRYSISYEPRNFKGRLSEFPRIMEYGMKVDSLRKKYSNFLWDGEYRDVLGATVRGKDVIYSVFRCRSNGKKAVVVLNINTNKPVRASVSIDGSKNSLIMVSPEKMDPVIFNGSVTIQPQSAIVIMEK